MHRYAILSLTAGVLVLAPGCAEQPTALEAAATETALTEAAQAGDGGRGGRGAGMRGGGIPGGIGRLLARQAELGLTDEQVARLEQIQAELQALNAPLLERLRAAAGDGLAEEELRSLTPEQRREKLRELRELRELRRQRLAAMTPEERAALRAEREVRMRELAPLREEIRSNGQAALERALAVLTPAQRALLQERATERVRTERRGRGGTRRSR